MRKILVILGPTALGKTDLALHFAKQLGGELVACDSRQLFKGLDIGSGKLPNSVSKVKKQRGFWSIDGIKVWMYDVISPQDEYSVANYVQDATRAIEDIIRRSRLPIIVGGSGLYLKGLLGGIDNLEVGPNPGLRKKLGRLTLRALKLRLKKLSPIQYAQINQSDVNNPRRLIRAIELIQVNPYIGIKKKTNIKNKWSGFEVLMIGLTAPQSVLFERIDQRVILRLNQGLIDEARELHESGLSFKRMKELGLEYGIVSDHLRGKINETQLINLLKVRIHQYAKRQLTWFKKESRVRWFDITDENFLTSMEEVTRAWYDRLNYAAQDRYIP